MFASYAYKRKKKKQREIVNMNFTFFVQHVRGEGWFRSNIFKKRGQSNIKSTSVLPDIYYGRKGGGRLLYKMATRHSSIALNICHVHATKLMYRVNISSCLH